MLKFKKMGTEKIPILLVTANVGSIFEDPTVMLPIWTSEFLQAVSRMDPKFIALHLQEVGGKTYEKSMQYVQDFVKRLVDCPELRLFDKIRIYLDEDFSTPESFTALGNLYFGHTSLPDVKVWDWELRTYVDVRGRELHCGNIEKVTTKEKAKFPKHFFPECKWSRKGFIRTRWSVRGTCIELINIHLFHDASNLIAAQGYPSVYTRSRRRALRHTLRHIHSDVNAAPYFIFGDFNFRPDTHGVIKKLTEDLTLYRCGDGNRLIYRGDNEDIILSVGKKEFTHVQHQTVFREPWFQKMDRELESLRPHLYEFPVKFPPSYPFEENIQLPTQYMNTRCPAWCDRVVLSQTARLLLHHDTRTAENKHLHASRKSVVDGDSSGRSSTDSSPNRSVSPAQQSSPSKQLEKKSSLLDIDALTVPGIAVARKSIADPTSVQQAISARVSGSDGTNPRRKLVRNQSEGGESEGRRLARPDYGQIGEHTCMGDHKPVYLRVSLHTDRGTVRCCVPPLPCICCALSAHRPSALPTTPLPRLYTDPHLTKKTIQRTGSLNEKMFRIPEVEITKAEYSSYDCIFVDDIDTKLLSARPLIDPYTPESVDSHTPIAKNDDSDNLISDKSVSPTQLKSRLTKLLKEKSVPELERLNSRDSCISSNSKKSGLCCLALKCYGFCRKNAKRVTCSSCKSKNGSSDCCE